MAMLFRVAAATEIALVCAEQLFPGTHGFLPLGGNPITQLGLLLGPSFVVDELCEAVSYAFTRLNAIRAKRHRRSTKARSTTKPTDRAATAEEDPGAEHR